MIEEFSPLSLERLLDWIKRELAIRDTIFGLHRELFRADLKGKAYNHLRRGKKLETPLGTAAGPHNQMAANIISSWLCGARFIELKTVQILDELDIPRPCIDMLDEGYNCEWSQELPIEKSAGEYESAYVGIRVLQREFCSAIDNEPGFVMDLSAGYDLEGIRSSRVQAFFDRLTVSSEGLKKKILEASRVYPNASDIPLPDAMADSITLSTMHGCPPEEIEKIGRFLIEERELNTTIKLNPTLLGPEKLRHILNCELGFETEVPDSAFEHDLKWDAAIDLIRGLGDVASRKNLSFGVKLTNTLECINRSRILPESSKMSYMSGRALHPVSVHVAAMLQEVFGGNLDISFSGGASALNFTDLVAAGLSPVTVCSDILRPGGYQRLNQYLDNLESAMIESGAADMDSFIIACASRNTGEIGDRSSIQVSDSRGAALFNLKKYAQSVTENPAYHKSTYPDRSIKTERKLGYFDCIHAPCTDTCPAAQDVASYMAYAAGGDFEKALEIIRCDNPFPNVTGMVCDQSCIKKCTRINYDEALRIRDIKRVMAHSEVSSGEKILISQDEQKNSLQRKVAVAGAGPAGLSCAWYLARAGLDLTVYETKSFPGGMISDAIPAFRLEQKDIDRDIERILDAGVELKTGEKIDKERLKELLNEYDMVFIGSGAQLDRMMNIPGEDLPGIMPSLSFLSALKRGENIEIGKDIIVIGGGNTAMDAARTAARIAGDNSTVRIVYRRTRAQMPAADHEIDAVCKEKVIIHELLAPVSIEKDNNRLVLTCEIMKLGEADESGRKRPEPTGRMEKFICDTIIPAIGQKNEEDLLSAEDLKNYCYEKGFLPGTANEKILCGGDFLRGPGTIIQAIADGRAAAEKILQKFNIRADSKKPVRAPELTEAGFQARASIMKNAIVPEERFSNAYGDFSLVSGELSAEQAMEEASRCLDCASRCDVCVSVCPNRANISYETKAGKLELMRVIASEKNSSGFEVIVSGEESIIQERQTANIADFCNACGNCETFCPSAGAPYLDKPRIALDEKYFESCDGLYHLCFREGSDIIKWKNGTGREELSRKEGYLIYSCEQGKVILDDETFKVRNAIFNDGVSEEISLKHAARMKILLDALSGYPLAERF